MTNDKPSFFERLSNWLKQSITIRLFSMGIIILLLLIPVSMVESLINEREQRQKDAIAEVSAKWGEEQTLAGPIISVPYKTYSRVYEGENTGKFKLVEAREYAHFLPEHLSISGEVLPEVRYRGIYEVIVYNSKIKLSGSFLKPSFEGWEIDKNNILWQEASISLGLSDLRSIQEDIALQWNQRNLLFNPGLPCNEVLQTGISAPLVIDRNDSAVFEIPFSLALNFNGSSGLHFIPLGKSTQVNLRSEWKSPSFEGAFLPDTRSVDATGFKASWEVLHLNRPYPQRFRGTAQGINESSFGVNLIVTLDEYQKSSRSAKYAVMFIALTFLVFFFAQILNGVKIHPIQYIIVGLALCVFYTLLIALSEHISFNLSYLISALSIISLITLYSQSIFHHKRLTGLICLILTLLYLFIYSIIQMEDYALLMGSIGLFLVLAVVMYLSRKIDWYAVKTGGQD